MSIGENALYIYTPEWSNISTYCFTYVAKYSYGSGNGIQRNEGENNMTDSSQDTHTHRTRNAYSAKATLFIYYYIHVLVPICVSLCCIYVYELVHSWYLARNLLIFLKRWRILNFRTFVEFRII